jgi:Uma2 family endonuclease
VAGEDEEEPLLREKARWYLRNGVPVVWLVLPATREVLVIDSQGERRFGSAQRLPANQLLPGLEPELSRFFAQLDK